MGPAAYAAIGRALGVALTTHLFGGADGLVAILAGQIRKAILHNDIETAKAMLRDLAARHRKIFEDFMKCYGDDLPAEAEEPAATAK